MRCFIFPQSLKVPILRGQFKIDLMMSYFLVKGLTPSLRQKSSFPGIAGEALRMKVKPLIF